MKLKELKEKQLFKMKLWGSVKKAEFVKNHGTRCEIVVNGKTFKLNSESEILGVLAENKKAEAVAEAKETGDTEATAEVQIEAVEKPKNKGGRPKKTEVKG